MTQDSNIGSASHCDFSCTQFQNARQEEPPLDVTIGLDFGTATTKVIVRTYYEPDRPGFAVDFKECAHASSSSILLTAALVISTLP